MPTTEAVQKSAERRAARKSARENAVDEAHLEQVNFSETLAASKAAAKTEVVMPEKPRRTRRDLVLEQKATAQAALKAQDQKTFRRADPQLQVKPGAPVPLYVLNQLAMRARDEAQDVAKDVARATAKAAFDAVSGAQANTRVKRDRYARVRDAQAVVAEKAAE